MPNVYYSSWAVTLIWIYRYGATSSSARLLSSHQISLDFFWDFFWKKLWDSSNKKFWISSTKTWISYYGAWSLYSEKYQKAKI